ncbi:hypothetical protein FJY63_06110, partial [Candidatus Sumerlaeota bacterium]|nr:hypothetical protein [Candidatus Sumerlaeota bacterium]
MCADQNRRHPSKFAAAFSFWRWWDSVIVLVVLAIAVATGVVCRIQPKATGVEPDSPEAWRALLQSDVESERLAALILLASEGDKDATGRLIESLPRLSLDQLQTAIDVLVHLSGPERLRPELVAAFLTHPHADKDGFSVLVLDLIPKGKEREYVVPLCAFFDTVAQRYRTLSSDGIRASHTWETIVKIVATGDKDALRRCTKFLS